LRNPPAGAVGFGLGGAAVASSAGAEALFYNPANIAEIVAPEAVAALTLARRQTNFLAPDGRRASSADDWQFLPNVAFAMPLERLGAGLGFSLTTPFGQASEWDAEGPFRYLAPHEAKMTFAEFTASIAVPLWEELSGGVGLSLVGSTLDLKQIFPWAMVAMSPMPDGEARIETDGFGVGAWAGATWRPVKGHRVGVVYRSTMRIEYEGDLTLEGHPGAERLPPPLGGTSRRSDISTTYRFPDIVSFGYAVDATESLVIEALAEWLNWSRYGDPTYDAGANSTLLPPLPPNDWSDTWNWAVGAAWRLDESWTARIGFTQLHSPVPDRSFSPILPDGDQDIYTIGLGYRRGAHGLDIAYAYARNKDRHIQPTEQSALSGCYDFDSDLVAISYRFEFR
jgi:long-chain fatty acid transport protein